MKTTTDFYVLNQPETVAEAASFAPWLLNAGRANTKVAVYGRQEFLVFATSKEVWSIDPRRDEVMAVIIDGFKRQAVDIPQVQFVARDLFWDIQWLVGLLASHLNMTPEDTFTALRPLFVGDLEGAARAAGWVTEKHSDYSDVVLDAYGTAIHEEQFSIGAAEFYKKIAVPFALLQAEAMLSGFMDTEWLVQYDDLWLRVLLHYTGDAVLAKAFYDGRSPLQAVATALDTTPDIAQALVLWQLYGRDAVLLSKAIPDAIEMLPIDLPIWGGRLERVMPNLVTRIIGMQQAYWQNRKTLTRYNRILRPGLDPGAASAWVVFGTVEDLMAVAAVSFWQNRTGKGIYINTIKGGFDFAPVRIGGTLPSTGKDFWRSTVEALAPLANPLSTGSLRPIYTEVK